MHIDVYADIACPWCYVGRAHLKTALDQRPDLDVTLQWRPFQLQPEMPAEGRDFRTMLEEKFGGGDRVERMFERIRRMGREDGLTFNFDAIEVAPNTADAHRLILWAEDKQGPETGDALATLLFRAYFTDGRNVSDPDVLVDCAGATGLDAEEARVLLDGADYADAVRKSQQRAQRQGITGVPCYVFDDRQALTGAQPVDAFLEALDAVQSESTRSDK
jgi:predicted DsbA family dithiol-disulfide isomerase